MRRLNQNPVSRYVVSLWYAHVFLELSDQLSMLLEAGLPLLEGIVHLQHDNHRKFRYGVLEETIHAVEAGEPLSTAWRNYIDPLFTSLIQSGEQSGQLAVVLKKHVLHMQARRKWISRVFRILSYPILLLIITIALLFYIANFVIPMFRNMYHQLGYPLSSNTVWVTRVLSVAPAVFLYTFLILFTVFVCILVVSVKKRISIRLIPFTNMMRLSRTRTISSQLGLLLSAGLPLVHALNILHETKRPRWLSEIARLAMAEVLGGTPVTEVFSTGLDRILPLMLHTAEKTGDLVGAFERTEVYAQAKLYKKMEQFVRFLEPGMLMIMGGVVGMTMYAVFIPMYDFINVVSSTSHS